MLFHASAWVVATERIRCGDHLAGNPQSLQRRDQANGRIRDEGNMFHSQYSLNACSNC